MGQAPSGIPPSLVERFARASAAFVAAVRDAVAEAAQNPALSGTPAFRAWQSQALPLLEEKDVSIQSEAALFLKGEPSSILVHAEDKRGLAKDLDGFPLTFAGPDRAGDLEPLETALVMAAYQLCAAAGIP